MAIGVEISGVISIGGMGVRVTMFALRNSVFVRDLSAFVEGSSSLPCSMNLSCAVAWLSSGNAWLMDVAFPLASFRSSPAPDQVSSLSSSFSSSCLSSPQTAAISCCLFTASSFLSRYSGSSSRFDLT